MGDSWGRWGERRDTLLAELYGGPGRTRGWESGDPPGCSVGPLRVEDRVSKWLPFQAFVTLFPQTQMHTQPDTYKCCYEI